MQLCLFFICLSSFIFICISSVSVAYNTLSCEQLQSLRVGATLLQTDSVSSWRQYVYRVNDTNETRILQTLEPFSSVKDMNADERRAQLQRRRDLALSRLVAKQLQGSEHVVRVRDSALQCGSQSAVIFDYVAEPLDVMHGETHCSVLQVALHALRLLDDLERRGPQPLVLCDWSVSNFRRSDDAAQTLVLVDLSTVAPHMHDAPLHGGLPCNTKASKQEIVEQCSGTSTRCLVQQLSLSSTLPLEFTCVPFDDDDVQSTDGYCRGFDHRSNLWGVGALLRQLSANDDALDELLGSLMHADPDKRLSTNVIAQQIATMIDAAKCPTREATDDLQEVDAVKPSIAPLRQFGSRYAGDRHTGSAVRANEGAPGSTPHCYLHPLFPQKCAPYFICIGAQKAGTQTFLDWAQRELHFWDYGGAHRSLADYYADLPLVSPGERGAGQQVVVGEKTPRYSVEGNPLAMHSHFPQMRLVFLVREPVSRAFSHFLHLRRRAEQRWRQRHFQFASFADAIRHSLFQFSALHACGSPLTLPWPALHRCVRNTPRPVNAREMAEHPADMLVRGLYAPIVQRWSVPHFPLDKQLLVVRAELLWRQPYVEMERITRFLNLTEVDWRKRLRLDSPRVVNRKADEAAQSLSLVGGDMTDDERALLYDFYRPYNDDLAQQLQLNESERAKFWVL